METDRATTAVVQNLRDAGCSPAFVERFVELQAQGRRERQLGLLSEQRARLLVQLHREQAKLDCLDYLIHKMRREGNGPY